MTTQDPGDESVLRLFDPLVSSPVSTRNRTRVRDPQSPVQAFFDTVDKSNHLLSTIKKRAEPDLIDFSHGKTPQRANIDFNRPLITLSTPLPLSKRDYNVTNKKTPVTVVDPFSPPAPAATSYQSFPRLNVPTETPSRGANPELLVSTFTPLPTNMPYLPNSSFGSLYASNSSMSSTASTSTTKRRRSSIDLDKEIGDTKSADSSFNILRDELDIGTSAEASFISSTAGDSVRMGSVSEVEESPWTMRNPMMDFGTPVLSIVREVRETSLLAHLIPLPDSPLTSPESSPIRNADASMHAGKIFAEARRRSMAFPNAALEFPQENDESPGSTPGNGHPTSRRPQAHTRTMSISSVGSSRSTATIRNISPSRRRDTTLANKPVAKPASTTAKQPTTTTAAKDRRSTLLPPAQTKRLGPSPSGSPSKAGAKRAPRASIATKATSSRVSLLGNGAKTLMAPPPAPASRVTKPRDSLASVASSGVASLALKGPRASIAPRPMMGRPSIASRTSSTVAVSNTSGMSGVKARLARGSMAPPPVPVKTISPEKVKDVAGKVVASKPLTTTRPLMEPSLPSVGDVKQVGGGALTSGTRANTGLRRPRPSSMYGALGGVATSAIGALKSIGTTTVKVEPQTEEPKANEGGMRRSRTSSAGAALMSRPPIGVAAADDEDEDDEKDIPAARPRPSVAGRLQRPNSVYGMARIGG